MQPATRKWQSGHPRSRGGALSSDWLALLPQEGEVFPSELAVCSRHRAVNKAPLCPLNQRVLSVPPDALMRGTAVSGFGPVLSHPFYLHPLELCSPRPVKFLTRKSSHECPGVGEPTRSQTLAVETEVRGHARYWWSENSRGRRCIGAWTVGFEPLLRHPGGAS